LGLKKIRKKNKSEFLRLFEIYNTEQNLAKGNKIAKTGLLKNCFFIHQNWL
jgi:hypothetical protein